MGAKDDSTPAKEANIADLIEIQEIVTDTKEANTYPSTLPLIILNRRPYFPAMTAPIYIEKGPYFDMIKELIKSEQKYIGLVLSKEEKGDVYGMDLEDVYQVGVVARILRLVNVENTGAQLILNMEQRFRIRAGRKTNTHLLVDVDYHKDIEPTDGDEKDELKAYSSSIMKKIRQLIAHNALYKDELQVFLTHSDFTSSSKLTDFSIALTGADRDDQQDILATFPLIERMKKALVVLSKECEISQLQSAINEKIETNLAKHQREYFLKEQLKAIQKELGINKGDKQTDIDRFTEKAEKLELSEEAKQTFEEELEKLSILDPQSAEYGVVRTYLDWLTALPWGQRSEDNNSLSGAKKILDKDHYGLKDIKERILEFISIGILKKTTKKGYILCLSGPPGVGKTSVGKSIARALGRKFYRFSVGGMKDESEIRGHRRTYVGAMPGKILQALKQTKSCNPVIMLDEIDKMAISYQGDPAAALLEALDPEQNKDFVDHYLNVPFDLSETLFIATCNTTEHIPPALRDRMEVLRLPGYIDEEKIEIAKKYLLPKNLKEVGLKRTDLSITAGIWKKLIEEYCREAGVRQLEKALNRILRKIGTEKVRTQEKKLRRKFKKVTLTQDNLKDYLGLGSFSPEDFYRDDCPSGVSMGLAFTETGGSLLYVESTSMPAKEKSIKLTGSAGEVMQESATIAWTYVISNKEDLLKHEFDESQHEMHLHVPEGATPKDGPSAGITMVSSMVSCLNQEPISANIAMTGEITLNGKVLPIGGLKEKIMAAKRAHIAHVICPKDNKKDFDELPSHVKKGVKMHFVDSYKQVFQLLFPKKRRLKRT